MGAKKTVITGKMTPVVKVDREKLSAYCSTIGHSETSLSTAYSNASYLSHRFLKYNGEIPVGFIDWCNHVYPRGKDALQDAIIQDAAKTEPKGEEQIEMTLPSVMGKKVVTIQPVSIVGFNQIVEALLEIAKRMEALEQAWTGKRGEQDE